eukprot:CAMPEP_0178896932 /NCGR_PEP_ID=MMETSP0786-20121207/1460_1 /TAXON_ID=186022 /ORGANISM="Thalassionema frauenfeldii, Strain CCMP 1798" /LENGTH=199 /DNA_ID=CAMNT_0020567415 /DNA_START=471 /DNA_END=1070 /DNA_ORIENTATION=-
MTTGDGSRILQSTWEGKRQQTNLRNYDWPTQGEPTKNDWIIWRRVLAKTVCNNMRQLITPLKQWTHQLHRTWWYDNNNDRIYFGKIGEKSQRWVPENRRARGVNRLYIPSAPEDTIPSKCTPTICIQDKTTTYKELVTWAKLNVDCDKLAGKYRIAAEFRNLNPRDLQLYKAPWRIIINSKKVTDTMYEDIYQQSTPRK